MSTYARPPVAIVKGQGVRVWDADGKSYLDFVAGIAVNALGHCHPNVVQAIKNQAEKLIHCSNLYWSEPQVRLAELLAKHSGLDQVFFCNSGAEANEAAIKLARKYSKERRGPNRYHIITMTGSFHGRTMGALTATAQEKIHHGFEPLLPGFSYAQFNDLSAVEANIRPETCAVMVEPVQGESGVNLAEPGFLIGLEKVCRQHQLLLIVDEVQCGLGRTGQFLAFQHFGIRPDIVVLAKALGGGLPIGAILATTEVASAFRPGSHGSTFGANPVACAASEAVIETLEKEGLIENARKQGEYFLRRLKELASLPQFRPLVKDVRGMGLMLAMELTIPGARVVDSCREKGLLINCTAENVLRFLPPLIVNAAEIDAAAAILAEALEEETQSNSKEEH